MRDTKAKEAAPTGANRREMREYYASRDRKKTRTVALAVIAALALLFAGALFINSGFMRRILPAVTIGGTDYSVVDLNYFYQNTFAEYQSTIYQSMPDFAESMLPTSGKSHKSQVHNEETGETWAQYVATMAIDRMKEITAMYEDALRNNFVLPDEDRQRMEEEIEQLRSNIALYGYKSIDDYLARMYGNGMNEKAFLRLAEITYLSDAYSAFKNEEFTYTEQQLNEYYESKKDMLDTFTYRYFLYRADMPNEADYGDDTAAYEEASAAAVAAAGELAAEVRADIKSEQDFIDAAREYDPVEYAEDGSTRRVYMGELLGSIYGTWLREAGRKYNDSTTEESSNGHYLVYFISREDNMYPTVNARELFVSIAEVNAEDYAEDETGQQYSDAVEEAQAAARSEAESLYLEWEAAGFTDEKLLELIPGNSDGTAEDGLYENIYKLQMGAEVDDWLFDANRAAGDHGLIESADGFRLVYYIGTAETYHDYLADTRRRKEDFDAWKDSLGLPEAENKWAYRFALENY
ncbi:MAG: hypothetical protein LBC21_00540 [Oscillospiraceae bacterium]|jgi:hypothetical protein|nr:hypothetical protein [Oscillospiraceae bacterium]